MRLVGVFVVAALALAANLVDADGEMIDFPVVLPPYHQYNIEKTDSWDSCLLYMENITITVFPTKETTPKAASAKISMDDATGNAQYKWDDSYAQCINDFGDNKSYDRFNRMAFNFTIDVKLNKPVSAFDSDGTVLFTIEGTPKFTLLFETENGDGWRLQDVLADGLNIKKSDANWLPKSSIEVNEKNSTKTSVSYMDVATYNQYNWACSLSRSAVFSGGDTASYQVGVRFGNLQVQAFGIANYTENQRNVTFGRYTTDCSGSFSSGSLMGIISVLVLIFVLMFGYLMLNSVQTIDRFDDPKQKQLLINAKE